MYVSVQSTQYSYLAFGALWLRVCGIKVLGISSFHLCLKWKQWGNILTCRILTSTSTSLHLFFGIIVSCCFIWIVGYMIMYFAFTGRLLMLSKAYLTCLLVVRQSLAHTQMRDFILCTEMSWKKKLTVSLLQPVRLLQKYK